ncbi:EAL domain-containing protein [Halioxenophilus sp. WMMB6]|uniref:EAL domain-containing protein n=1 Tax=Halioxenophilus sp. WMMB6 TaxID=3073815 RepID=UPI00295E9E99|nr:EAL domain-containing protein [Halioxenophilus sp. WMMB6]
MGKSVLYVEDDVVQATLIQGLLEDEGYSVVHAEDGAAALELLAHNSFDVILTDHYMPAMNGVQLIETINQRAIGVPVVIMTAANDISLAFAALKAGAADFIAKDMEGNYLAIIEQVLARAIEKHRLAAESAALKQRLALVQNLARTTLDTLKQGVVVLDGEHSIRYCNRQFKELFGVPTNEEVIGYSGEWLVNLIAQRAQVNGLVEQTKAVRLLLHALEDSRIRIELMVGDTTLAMLATTLENEINVYTFSDITHERAQLNAIHAIIEHAPVAMMVLSKYGSVVMTNQKAGQLLQATPEELVNRDIRTFVPALGQREAAGELGIGFTVQENGEWQGSADLVVVTSEGATIPVEMALQSLRTNDQDRILATIVDISHRKLAEQAMRRANQLTQSIVEHSPFALVATDTQGEIIAVSPALETMLGYRRDELVGRQKATIFHEPTELQVRAAALSSEWGAEEPSEFEAVVEKASLGIVEGSEWIYQRKDGSSFPVNLTATQLRSEDGTVTGYLLVSYDITEQKKAHEYIEFIAHHDGLTGLPNRNLMRDRLEYSLHRLARTGKRMGVLMMDLDYFKRINDTLGHLAGDQLLVAVAERLQQAVRRSDTVCRMGGDEFVVLLPDINSADDAEQVCRKILDMLVQPIQLGRHQLVVTPSIGVSMAPDDGTSSETLLKHADIAMYYAKQTGRNGYQIFSLDMVQANQEEQAIEQALQAALHNGHLDLHYQPQVDLASGNVVGFEALIRWVDPARGVVAPAQFIPLAETTGFVIKLGEWVLERACADIKRLNDRYQHKLYVSVNVSPRQFEDNQFVASVENALAASNLPASSLQLEITEALLVAESASVKKRLTQLREMGVTIAIDDFGTGNVGLGSVTQFPIDRLKIDRRFMRLDIKSNQAVVAAILAMAQGMELEVLAEGIENREQLNFVRQLGCSLAQGHYYYPALSLAEVGTLLQTDQSANL